MLKISWEWETYCGTVLKTAPQEPFQPDDSILIHPFADRLRVALIDGITDTPYTKRQANLSGGSWAASVVEASLKAPQDNRTCLLWANNILWDRHQQYRRAQQQASVVVIDLFSDGRLEAIRAGDTFFAVKERRWEKIFAGDPRDPEVIQEFIDRGLWQVPGQFQTMQQFLAFGAWTPEDYAAAAEDEPFTNQDDWSSTPVGAFQELKIERIFLQPDQWQQVALGTDGAEPEDTATMEVLPTAAELGADESFCLLARRGSAN